MARKATTKDAADPARPSLKNVEFTAGNAKEHVKAVGASTKTIYMVPIEHLHVAPGYNIRTTNTPEYKEAIQSLTESILQEGFYSTKPLAGYVAKTPAGADAIFITDGHRRFEAVKQAQAQGAEGLEKLPVILKAPATDAVGLTVSLIRENEQSALTSMEKAIAARRLMAGGMSKEDIAKRLSMTTRAVDDLIVLVNAPKEVRELVKTGKVSATQAVKAVRDDKKAGGTEKVEKLTAVASQKQTGPVQPKDLKPATSDPDVKMDTIKSEYGLLKGDTAQYAEIQPFLGLFADSDWYELTEREGVIRATEDFNIRIIVRRPKKAKVIEEPAEPKKRGRPKKDEPPGVEVDPMTLQGVEELGEEEVEDEGEEGDTPDLRALGIADGTADPAEGL